MKIKIIKIKYLLPILLLVFLAGCDFVNNKKSYENNDRLLESNIVDTDSSIAGKQDSQIITILDNGYINLYSKDCLVEITYPSDFSIENYCGEESDNNQSEYINLLLLSNLNVEEDGPYGKSGTMSISIKKRQKYIDNLKFWIYNNFTEGQLFNSKLGTTTTKINEKYTEHEEAYQVDVVYSKPVEGYAGKFSYLYIKNNNYVYKITGQMNQEYKDAEMLFDKIIKSLNLNN